MKFSENPDYGFAIGRVRAKEAYLIKRSEYDRMVTIASVQELLSNVKTIWQFETSEKESAQFENLLAFARSENEQFFIKYCLDKTVQQLSLDNTFIKNKLLQDYLQNLNNEFLTEYFNTVIDLENIRSLIRIKNLAEKEKQDISSQKKLFVKVFVAHGSINQITLTDLLNEPWEELIRWSANTPYHDCVEQGISYLLNKKSFLRLERLIQEQKQKILIQTRYATFGYEPLVAYYLFKDNEIRNLRKIYYGVTEKTPADQIRESVGCIL